MAMYTAGRRLQAKKKIQRSMVADNQSGKSVMSEVRTSSGMFLNKRQVRSVPPSSSSSPVRYFFFTKKKHQLH